MRSDSCNIGEKRCDYRMFTVSQLCSMAIDKRKWTFPEFGFIHLAQLIQCIHGFLFLTTMASIPRSGCVTANSEITLDKAPPDNRRG